MEWLSADTWSPYVVGIGLGVLSWFTFLLSNNTLGCSTSFSRFSGMIEKVYSARAVAENEYYKKTAPVVDWQVMLVLGVIIGSFLSAALPGYLRWEMLPSLWAAQFGEGSSLLRFFVALLGSGIFAHLYAKIKKPVLTKGTFAHDTIPELLKVNPWVVVIPVVLILAFILWLIEYPGA